MLYIAFVKNKPRWQLGDVDLTAKSRQWWNEGQKPAGLRTVGFWGSLSSEAPDVIVFEAESHEDIRKMIAYWKEVATSRSTRPSTWARSSVARG